MTTTYTDEDVQTLVDVATRTVDALDRTYGQTWQIVKSTALHIALKPFKPDPDAQTIEDMACEMWKACRDGLNTAGLPRTWGEVNEGSKDVYRAEARAALAYLREKGMVK